MAVKSHGSPYTMPAVAALSAAILAGGLSACSSDTSDYYANCVDPVTHQVVDPQLCDDNSGYYIWMAPQSYGPGYVVPTRSRSGSGWFRSNDTTARTNAGLPATGEVPTGSRVTSSSGGFDGVHKSSSSSGGDEGGGEEGSSHGSGGS